MSGSESAGYQVRIAPSSDGSGKRGPPEHSPREAMERWLDKLRVDKAESTISSYEYRLKHLIEWCEAEGITSIGELNGWILDKYEIHRRSEGMKRISLNKELGTVENFLEYCAKLGLVDESLPEKVDPPDITKEDQVDETRLHAEDARQLLSALDNNHEDRHSRKHALLAVTWYVGCRLGGMQALDLEHYNSDDQTLEFVHNSEQDTPLKNGTSGERIVALQDEVCEILDGYIAKNRLDGIYDDFGRAPLFPSEQGRLSKNGLRSDVYMATYACIHSPCPHGNDSATCEFIGHSDSSKCPSSRSPHQVRTGSITWQLNQGVPIEVVAKRVNASVRTIKQHYDKPDKREEMEKRRRSHIDGLSLDKGGGEE